MTQQDRTATHARWQYHKPMVLEAAPNLFVVDTPHVDPVTLARTCLDGEVTVTGREDDEGDLSFYPLSEAHHEAVTSTRLVLTIEQLEALHAAIGLAVGPNVTFERITPEEVSSNGR